MKVGRVTENAMKRSILRQIKTRRDEVIVGAGLGEDCAIFSFRNRMSAQVNPDEQASVMLSCVQEGVFPVDYLVQSCANIHSGILCPGRRQSARVWVWRSPVLRARLPLR